MAGDDSVPILVRLPKKTRPEEPKSSERPLKKQKTGDQKHKKDKKDKKKHAHGDDKGHKEGDKIHKDGDRSKKDKKRSREGTEEGPPKKKKRSKDKRERGGVEDAKASNHVNQPGSQKDVNGNGIHLDGNRKDTGGGQQEEDGGGVVKTSVKPKASVHPSGDSEARAKKAKAEPTGTGQIKVAGSKPSADKQGQDSEQEDPPPSVAAMEDIISRLQKKDTYLIFAEPVDAEQVPDYYDVIKNPMDFTTMRKRMARGLYRTWDDFQTHVELMFDNAQKYNSPDTIFYKTAKSMQEASRKMIEVARGALGAGQRKRQVASRFKEESAAEPKKKLSGWGGRRIKGQKLKDFPGVDQLIQKGLSFDELARLGAKQTAGKVGGKAGDEGKQTWSDANDGEDVPGYRKTKEFWGPRDGRLPLGSAEYKRSTYHTRELHILGHGPRPSAPGGESHVLVPTGWHPPYAYARSLCRFAANLPDSVWDKVVAKVEKVLPPGVKFGRGWVGEEERPCGGEPKPPAPTILSSTIVKTGPQALLSPGAKPEALVGAQSAGAKPETGASLATAANTGPGAEGKPVTAGVNAPGTGVNAPGTGVNAPGTGLNTPGTSGIPQGTSVNAPGTSVSSPAAGLPAASVNTPLVGATARAQPSTEPRVPPLLVVPSTAVDMNTEDKPIGVAFGLNPTPTGRLQSASSIRPDFGVKLAGAPGMSNRSEPLTDMPVKEDNRPTSAEVMTSAELANIAPPPPASPNPLGNALLLAATSAVPNETGPSSVATSAGPSRSGQPAAATSAALSQNILPGAALPTGPSGSGPPAAATSTSLFQSTHPVGATSAPDGPISESTETVPPSLDLPLSVAQPESSAVFGQVGSADVSIPPVSSVEQVGSANVSIPPVASAEQVGSADVGIPPVTLAETASDVVEAAAALRLNANASGGGSEPVLNQQGEKAPENGVPGSTVDNVEETSEAGPVGLRDREQLGSGELGSKGDQEGSPGLGDRSTPEEELERREEAVGGRNSVEGQAEAASEPLERTVAESGQVLANAPPTISNQATREAALSAGFEPREPGGSSLVVQELAGEVDSPVAGPSEHEEKSVAGGLDDQAWLKERADPVVEILQGEGAEEEKQGPVETGRGGEGGGLTAREESPDRGEGDTFGGVDLAGTDSGGVGIGREDAVAGGKETGSQQGGGQLSVGNDGGELGPADGLGDQGEKETDGQQRGPSEELTAPAVTKQPIETPVSDTAVLDFQGGSVDTMVHDEAQLPSPVSTSQGAEEAAPKPGLAGLTLPSSGSSNKEAKPAEENPSTPNVASVHQPVPLGSPLVVARGRSPSPSMSPGSSRAVSLERGASTDPPIAFGSPLSVQSYRGSSLAPMSRRADSVNRERSSSLDVVEMAGPESKQ